MTVNEVNVNHGLLLGQFLYLNSDLHNMAFTLT
jgi:hypothetical protein